MSAKGTIGIPHDQLIRVLTAAAMHHGNMRAAREELVNRGEKLPDVTTLNKYRRNEPELYEKIRRDITERLRMQEAAQHLEVAAEARAVVKRAVGLTDAQLDKLSPSEIFKAARDMATVSGIHTDKAKVLIGEEHGGITVNINLAEQVRGLAAEGGEFYDDAGNKISIEQAVAIAQRKAIPEKTDDSRDDIHIEGTAVEEEGS